MADTNPTLDILIKLGVIGKEDATAVVDLLGKTKTLASETGSATGKLNETINEGGKAAEKSHLSHRALHQILHLIGHEAGPAAGAALSALAAAATGGVMVAIMAVRELFEWLHQAAEEAKRFKEVMEARIDISGMVKGIKDVQDAVDDTGKEIDKFFEKLRNKADGHEFKKMADEQIEHLKRVADAEKKLAGDQAEREKARLEILKSTHQITDAEYKAGIAAANDLKGKKESQIQGQMDSQSTAALQDALQKIVAQMEAAARELQGEKGKTDQSKHIETLAGLYEANQKRVEDLQKAQGETPSYGGAFLNSFKHPTESVEAYRQRIQDELAEQMEIYRGQEASLRRQIEAAKKITSDKDKIKELEEKLTGEGDDRTAITDELRKRGDQSTVDKDQGTAETVQKFIEAQGRLQSHQGESGDAQLVEALNRLLQASKKSDRRTYLLIQDLIEHKGDFAAALEELHRQLGDSSSRSDRPTS